MPLTDLPAIYASGAVDDRSISQALSAFGDQFAPWEGSSIYYEPLAARGAALLEALSGTESAKPEAIKNAAIFLELLPLLVPDPAVIVEDDGQIGLDWREGDKALSLNIGQSGMIGYSALFGIESAYGRAPFSHTEIPARIAPLLLGLATERQAR